MRRAGPAMVAAVLVLAYLVFNSCTYIVTETDQVVVT